MDTLADAAARHRFGLVYVTTSMRSCAHVLKPGYLDRFCEHGIRRHDRIMLAASAYAEEAEFAWLAVQSNDKGVVKAKILSGGAP